MASTTPTYCHCCKTYKVQCGPFRLKCKCDKEQDADKVADILTFQVSNAMVPSSSYNSIQRSVVLPKNGAMTRHYNNIERGVQTYQRIVMKNGKPAEMEEFNIYSTD